MCEEGADSSFVVTYTARSRARAQLPLSMRGEALEEVFLPTGSLHATVTVKGVLNEGVAHARCCAARLIHSPPSLRHFVTQGLLRPSVAVLG